MKHIKLFEQIISEDEYPNDELVLELTIREKSILNEMFGEDYLEWAFEDNPEIKKDDGYYYVKYGKKYQKKFEMFEGFGKFLTWMALQGVIKLNSSYLITTNYFNKLKEALSSTLLDPSSFYEIIEASKNNSDLVMCLWNNPNFKGVKNINTLLIWATRHQHIYLIKDILKYPKSDLDIKSAIDISLSMVDNPHVGSPLSYNDIILCLLDDERAKKIYTESQIDDIRKYLDKEVKKFWKNTYGNLYGE